MKKDARLTLRITSETKRALEVAAKRRDRSVNWLAQMILDRWAGQEAARQQKRTPIDSLKAGLRSPSPIQ